jgi:hypothetical protein
MPPFGRKANRDIQRFGKKLGVKRNFGRKLVNTIEKVGSVIGRVADIASLVNPELAPLSAGVKGISGQAGGLARSGVALTGKKPDFEQIEGQISAVKQGAKDIKAARDVLQKKKPSVMEEDSGIEFRD